MVIKKAYTIKDIAREAGVSPSLVSFALNNTLGENGQKRYKVNDETARRILAVAEKFHYTQNNAARSLRSRRSRTIGVILSDISNNFFSNIARHIEDKAFSIDYSVLFGSTDENPEKLARLIRTMLGKGVDGLIVVACEHCEAIVNNVLERNVPLVLLDRDVESVQTNRVVLDNEAACSEAVRRLYEGGYRRIEMISYDMSVPNIAHREVGYRFEMERLGLADYIRVHRIGYEGVDRSMAELMRSLDFNETDALIFATNSLSVAGVKEIHRMGFSISREIGVVAFDGSEAFDLYPVSIAYIKQPIEQFAQEALLRVVRQIEHPETLPTRLVLAPTFVDGDSVRRRE
jgi:LacI family transcriptional regulator